MSKLHRTKVLPYTGRPLHTTQHLIVYFRNILTQKEQSAVFIHWRFSSRRTYKTFCLIKVSRPRRITRQFGGQLAREIAVAWKGEYHDKVHVLIMFT
jgi:hypothetical protein